MTIENNLKNRNAIVKISDLVDELCEYFDTEDGIDGDDTFIKIEEHDKTVSIRIDREYVVMQKSENTSLRDLIALAEDVSIIPDGEIITVIINISI